MGSWFEKTKKKGISIVDQNLTDVNRADIDILIGSDYRESLMTGRRVDLGDGMYAVESIFGWILCGPQGKVHQSATDIVIQSYLTGDISKMWDLDLIGIRDSAYSVSKTSHDEEVKRVFQQQLLREPDGRYKVKLPWVSADVKKFLPSNYIAAEKRLTSATAKLYKQEKYSAYDDVFKMWEAEGIIKSVREGDGSGHYLPHRPVFRPESETTPVRPVFDASCRTECGLSLNQCLEKGPNLLDVIPSILIRFREKAIGVTSDVRKAFQMISVSEEDRIFQRFLWWERNGFGEKKTFEHCRVVFGMNCSPFILAAVLDFHLRNVPTEEKPVADLLSSSLYVDNSVLSFDEEAEYLDFRNQSTAILARAKMDLRQWETSLDEVEQESKVLGLKWKKREDSLSCRVEVPEELGKITKRSVLSQVAKVFDPVGFTAPALLRPKLWLQESWSADLGWDEEWTPEKSFQFATWIKDLSVLAKINIPRCALGEGVLREKKVQIHAFSDASQEAYACAVFARTEFEDKVAIQLLAAKSRVAPLDKLHKKRVTIPRLELLGCLIAARLSNMVRDATTVQNPSTYFWSDSTTALAWIRRNEDWGTFVGNRVREILKLTDVREWRHVPGSLNPADLPSRGCSAKQLLTSRWWEGPEWLRNEEDWPMQKEVIDEEEVNRERKKTSMVATEQVECVKPRFGSYLKNLRVRAWVRRFLSNSRVKKEGRSTEKWLSGKEMRNAEVDLLRVVQRLHYPEAPNIRGLDVEVKEDGLYRVRTRLLFRNDSKDFRFPILLPKKDPYVHQLIEHIHRSHCHAGTQFVLGKLRERYWIVQGRKTINGVIHRCTVCRRYSSKPTNVEPAPLPQKRVQTASAFQTTGVDLAGPVYIKGGKKCWIVLYTCAVYRGVSLDIVESLDVEAFLRSLERFIYTVGRPSTFYSDNGTNFVGAKNLMKVLNWDLLREKSQVKKIQWTLIPPAAPWWGGWWERIIRMMKEMLRKMLGRAKLTYDELRTCLAAVSYVINNRPLTTLTEDAEDMTPLTPALFLRDIPLADFPEGSMMTGRSLQMAYRKMQTLKTSLQARFRKEYLSLLVQNKNAKPKRPLSVGEVVLVGSDNKRRYEWPLGRIQELIKGKDGKVRVAKVKTVNSVLLRPLQRLYPLEVPSICSAEYQNFRKKVEKEEKENTMTYDKNISEGQQDAVITKSARSGRAIKRPTRYGSWN